MKKILIVGEYGIDRFVYGKIERLNPEAPTPVIVPTSKTENWGMAANVFKNLESLNYFELNFLSNTEPIIKTRYVDEKSNYILLRVDENDNTQRIKNIDEEYVSRFDAVVISDYNKGFLKEEDIQKILSYSKFSFIDTKKPLGDWCWGADWIKINEKEFNNPLHDQKFIRDKSQSIIVTLGSEGARHHDKIFPTWKSDVIDVVGAGDTFMSAFVYATVKDRSLEKSLIFANRCSSEAVKMKGVSLLGNILKSNPKSL
jgi:D-beta-D-heptose 7-phosphate kinase/D-beta-D-heptose 1-phosphate adenosyltransferase